MPKFESSKTHGFFVEVLAMDALAYARLIYFARQAEAEGNLAAAAVLREVADGELNHALSHLDFLKETGDPVTEMPIGSTRANIESAIESTNADCNGFYRRVISTAKDEQLFEAVDWLESVMKDKGDYLTLLRTI